MDLTLLSIAAVLLLLTAPGARAQGSAGPVTARDTPAGLMRQLFGEHNTAAKGALWYPNPTSGPYTSASEQSRHRSLFLLDQVFACTPGASPQTHRASRTLGTCRPNPRHAGARQAQHAAPSILFAHLVTPSPSGGYARKQYRTRFGFANGAYCALAPPSLI